MAGSVDNIPGRASALLRGIFVMNPLTMLKLVTFVLGLSLTHWIYGGELEYVEAEDSATKGLVLEYHSFPDSTGLLRSAWIRSICVTNRGIYIANCGQRDWPCQGGLTFYDPINRQYKHFRGKCVIEPPPDYEPNTPLPCNYVSRAVWDGNRLWVVTGGGWPYGVPHMFDPNLGLFTFDGKEWQNMEKKAIDVTMIGDEIFIQAIDAKSGKSLWDVIHVEIYDLTSNELRILKDFEYLKKQKILGPFHIAGDSTRLFFAGYESFPVRRHKELRPVLYSYNRRKHEWDKIEGVGAERVINIYWDGSHLWVYGYYQNVEKYHPKTRTWQHHLFGGEYAASRSPIRLANCLVRYGKYLIAGFEGIPLAILDTETGAVRVVDDPKWISGTYVHELVLDGDTLWIGTRGNNGGLTRLDLRVVMRIAFSE